MSESAAAPLWPTVRAIARRRGIGFVAAVKSFVRTCRRAPRPRAPRATRRRAARRAASRVDRDDGGGSSDPAPALAPSDRDLAVESFGRALDLADFAICLAREHTDVETCCCPGCTRLSLALDFAAEGAAALWLSLEPDDQSAWLDDAGEHDRGRLAQIMKGVAAELDLDELSANLRHARRSR